MDFSKLIARVRSLLLSPRTEWPLIAAEPATVASLYRNWILWLAAVPALAGFIKMSILGYGAFGIIVRVPFMSGLTGAIVQFALSLGLVYVMGLIIDALAPSFGARKDRIQALKTAAYAWSASWVAGAAVIIPWLGTLVMLAGGIYSIYLLYLGLPHTMKAPPEKAAGYTAVSIIIAIVLGWILGLIVAGITGTGALMAGKAGLAAGGNTSVTIDTTSPLGWAREMGKRVDEANRKMEAARESGDSEAAGEALGQMFGAITGGGDVEALDGDTLKGFLPERLGGLKRSEFKVERQTMFGVQLASAEATYGEGRQDLELEIVDLGAVSGLAALAGFAREEETHSSDGYSRTHRQGGRIISEEWNGGSGHGQISMLVGKRFKVTLSGHQDMAALKKAFMQLRLDDLEKLGTRRG